jgi:hypothetical protein
MEILWAVNEVLVCSVRLNLAFLYILTGPCSYPPLVFVKIYALYHALWLFFESPLKAFFVLFIISILIVLNIGTDIIQYQILVQRRSSGSFGL